MLSKNPRDTLLALLFCAAQFLCIASGQLAMSFLHQKGVNGFKHEDDFGNVLLATLSFQGATWILIPIYLRLRRVRWRDAFGLSAKKVFLSLGLAPAVLVVVLPAAGTLQWVTARVMTVLHWKTQQETAVELFLTSAWWPTGMYLAVFAVVLAPVAEEFIFRGVLFPLLKAHGYYKSAWIGVSLLFAFIHGDAAIFPALFVLALALTWLYQTTGGLLAPIMAHSLFNAANLAVFYLANTRGG
ncbi:MAG: CPBP family intramembrane metalloprotease [Verrucomicrobia bacterium]|nr:CPBP family intramembrane metalloprotease [Verrucomicrobiota bacterium]MDE3098931.1 CPBP family intramembrane metalloprotease [Verrucomicrobiota bacterium]